MSYLPHLVFTTNEIKNIEKHYALSHGGDCYALMERAGFAVFNHIMAQDKKNSVWIFAGKGNNGGDGYVVAYHLLVNHIDHKVFATSVPHEGTEAYIAYKRYLASGGRIYTELFDADTCNEPDVIVDALLGTGLKKAPYAPYDEWILYINKFKSFTISIDIPSGLNSDTGDVKGDCVISDLTVCMLGLKPGLLTLYAKDYVGDLVVENLGLDVSKFYNKLNVDNGGPYIPYLNRYYENIVDDLPVRMQSANKGDCGKVLIIAGAFGMGGAARIAGIGAARSGTGLIKVATDERNFAALNAGTPELMTVNYHDDKALMQALSWSDVVAIGPGLSQSTHAKSLVQMLDGYKGYVVFDADALNILSANNMELNCKKILTPHPAEAARLLQTTVAQINEDRYRSAYLLQQKFGGIVLLKGSGTIVCDGLHLTVINEGSPAMATGGMGDLLTGMIAAFIAQGLSANTAVVAAACVHGRAGFLCGSDNGLIGTLATDLSFYIRRLVNASR